MLVFLAAIAAGLFVSFPARGASGDEHWDSQFNWPGTTNIVYAIAVHNGKLYAGGSFTNMGGTPANHIAKWDGTNWSALGSGTVTPGSSGGTVSALAGLGNDLYAGGTYHKAGDKNSFNLARWNGQINFDTPQGSVLLPPGGQFRIRLFGIGGQTNVMQATTNFTAWTPVLTNTGGIYNFTDSNSAGYPFRYYRAVLGP